ncbi:hypothetical protein [[Clostridium] hylemonae]|uniref:hypothetical protein n=1 Tax=[Clostridium] hylemonae TaxID=89153 RepID=UPI001D083C17|nr:hypothetical protein [[Clostridium] hylemonae]
MSLGQAARNVVRIGKKLVAIYEKKSCTTADKAKKQKAAASTGTLVGASVLDLLWNSGKAAVVGTGARAAASPYVVVGGILFLTVWWMNPIEAGESEEDVKKAQKKWEEAEKSKGTSGASEQEAAEKARQEGKPREKHKTKTGRSGDLKTKGEPNSSEDLYNENGELLQRRYYDKNGNVEYDIDYKHDNSHNNHKFPHGHEWEWKDGKPIRH